MGKGIIRITKELMLDMLMLEGFNIVNASFNNNKEIELHVESDCIESDRVLPNELMPQVKPIYRNKHGITRLEDILIDGKSNNKSNRSDINITVNTIAKDDIDEFLDKVISRLKIEGVY